MTRVGERDQLISRVWLSVIICFWLGIIALHYHCYDLFVCLFFMLKLLQYCNYIIIVIQIKLMLLLYMRTQGAFVGQKQLIRTPETGLER